MSVGSAHTSDQRYTTTRGEGEAHVKAADGLVSSERASHRLWAVSKQSLLRLELQVCTLVGKSLATRAALANSCQCFELHLTGGLPSAHRFSAYKEASNSDQAPVPDRLLPTLGYQQRHCRP